MGDDVDELVFVDDPETVGLKNLHLEVFGHGDQLPVVVLVPHQLVRLREKVREIHFFIEGLHFAVGLRCK